MNWKDKLRNPECELCDLHEEAEHVCLMGSGTRKAEIMIVGEAPGAREDEQHQAFVGSAGKLLDELLETAGLSRKDCYITNAAKCRPPDNRTPTKPEIKTCVEGYLSKEIGKVEPRFMLLLGNSALYAVTRSSGITKHRGKEYHLDAETVALATFHPAAVLRNPRFRPEVEADFARFGRMVRGEKAALSPSRVRVIRTKSQLKWLKRKLDSATHIAFDIETTGLKEEVEDAKITSIGFAWDEGECAALVLDHSSERWSDHSKVLAYLKPSLEREDCKYIAHNGKFDCRWLAKFGVYVPLHFDTMLAAHLLDENRSKSLKVLSQVILGADAYDIGEDVRDSYNVPEKRLCIYNAKDCDYTLRLYWIFREQLLQEPRLKRIFTKLMMPASHVLTKVERLGIYVDNDQLATATAQTVAARSKVMKKLLKHVPEEKRDDINFNSPQQVGKWLFGDLGLDVIEETKTGNPATGEAVLLKLAQKHKAPRLLIEYRLHTKRLNTYLEPWANEQDEKGRIHTNYKLFGTVTGRIASDNPNLQNIPRDPLMRSCFAAPPGWAFVKADYSQAEMRLAAMCAGEANLLRLFQRGADPHLDFAAELTSKPPEDIESEERKKAKSANFGLLYDMYAQGLKDYMWEKFEIDVTLEEAERIYKLWHRKYPGFKKWYKRQITLAERYERVHSKIGRVRRLPDIRSENFGAKLDAQRQAINSVVQSLASDLQLISMVLIDKKLPPNEGRVVETTHDEVGFEIREGYVDKWAPVIKHVMEVETLEYVKKWFDCEITVPMEAEVKVGPSWAGGEVWDDNRS